MGCDSVTRRPDLVGSSAQDAYGHKTPHALVSCFPIIGRMNGHRSSGRRTQRSTRVCETAAGSIGQHRSSNQGEMRGEQKDDGHDI